MNTKAMLTVAGILAVGILAGSVLTDLAGGQQRVKHTDPVPRSERDLWPPRPESIVNEYFDSVDYGMIVAGETKDLYQVPAGQWLIVTAARGGNLDVVEHLHGNTTRKLHSDFMQIGGYISATTLPSGAAFRPGSSVALRRDFGGNPLPFSLSIHGYLADG